jgi:hypothetical protein
MITFKINREKSPKADGRLFWDLLNEGNGLPHNHAQKKEPDTTQKKLTSIGADIKEDTYKGATAQLSDIALKLDRIEKQNNAILDHLAERAIGDE